MALYEMSVILKNLGDAGIRTALKRHLGRMLDRDAVIFSVENLGLKRLPTVFHVENQPQLEGHYFVINYDSPLRKNIDLIKAANSDGDVIKCFFQKNEKFIPPCKIENSEPCVFGEIRNPNYEKTSRRYHGFRAY